MGLLDDVLGSALPGGNLAKPLMIGLAALLGAGAVGGGSEIYSEGLDPGRRSRRLRHLLRQPHPVSRKADFLPASAACCKAFSKAVTVTS